MNEFYTVKQIAEKYQLNSKTVYGWVSLRFFPVVKLNGFLVRIPRKEFEKWIEKIGERKSYGKT